MAKTAQINARIDPAVKTEAEEVFNALGLTASQAITLFYQQVRLHRGLPFPVEIPNRTTRTAIKEAHSGEKLRKFDSPDDLFEELEI